MLDTFGMRGAMTSITAKTAYLAGGWLGQPSWPAAVESSLVPELCNVIKKRRQRS